MTEQKDDMQWYIIHTYSGYENKVKESIEQRFTALGKEDSLGISISGPSNFQHVSQTNDHRGSPPTLSSPD